jgi:hypothetical protein
MFKLQKSLFSSSQLKSIKKKNFNNLQIIYSIKINQIK